MKNAGYKGVVFDKDNCLTLPHEDKLVPELTEAWEECRQAFGEGNVLIVSNSAGTPQFDGGGIQAESIKHHLKAPVLFHKSLKPSHSCIHSVRNYFSSLPAPIQNRELVVIGDRIFTDIIMANRMKSLAIWTTGVWKKESMLLRWMEKKLVDGISRWTTGTQGQDLNVFLKIDPRTKQATPDRTSNSTLLEGLLARIVRRSS